MNVLLTCAGRRNYLLNYFVEALGEDGRVFAADVSQSAPAMMEASQAFVVPPVCDPDYFDRIFEICINNRVKLLISLNDLELPLLARQKDRFIENGIIPIVSSPNVTDICFDKLQTLEFLTSIGIAAPFTASNFNDAHDLIDKGKLHYPLVVKPRWGTASIGLEYVEDAEELAIAYRIAQKRIRASFLASVSAGDFKNCVLVEEKLVGEEYGLDIVNDLSGTWAATLVKRKLSMRAGETDRAISVQDHLLEDLGRKIGTALGHVGNLDCDVFLTDRGPVVLDMNPRFGGGYPFSHAAGANVPAALIAWAKRQKVDPGWLRLEPDVLSAKCDRIVTKKPR